VLTLSIVETATKRALRSGALQPIATESCVIEDGGIQFVVRFVSSLARKAAARAGPADPLGDYEPDLFVADVSATHYVLLNKFNVLPKHLLVVTRRFEPQEAPLTLGDFEALARSTPDSDWLAFHNAGRAAGASQPRKHLQLVPMPSIPIEPFIEAGGKLPFKHALTRVTGAAGPVALHDLYENLLGACGIRTEPYNLLIAPRWMLLVPRLRERFETLSVNAVGFAGSLFARTRGEVELIRAHGPISVLRAVALAAG
jgi:ATP adenylyltransferase